MANAARAAKDPEALAYLGDFYSGQVLVTAPLLGEARLLQVAPVATFVGLGGPTLVRLTPHDGVGAVTIAKWLVEQGVGELLVVHDHDPGYGVPVGTMCVEAALERGVSVGSRPVWHESAWVARDLRGAEAVLYVGVAGSGAVDMWHNLHTADRGLWLLGSEGVALPWFARELEPSAAERTRFFVAQHASFGLYGYEAMCLILDSIEAGNRAAAVETARSTTDRDSVIGRYSIDQEGHTTSQAYGRLAIEDGDLVWDL